MQSPVLRFVLWALAFVALGVAMFFAGFNYGVFFENETAKRREERAFGLSPGFNESDQDITRFLALTVDMLCRNQHYETNCGTYGEYLERNGRACEALLWYRAVEANKNHYVDYTSDRFVQRRIDRAQQSCEKSGDKIELPPYQVLLRE
ncbi:MAG TPA: hypothetical protein PKW95_04730 [bacterium]|nr:hypothetical protein [bacterium]